MDSFRTSSKHDDFVHLRLSRDILCSVDSFVEGSVDFNSRSHFIRAALLYFLRDLRIKEECGFESFNELRVNRDNALRKARRLYGC